MGKRKLWIPRPGKGQRPCAAIVLSPRTNEIQRCKNFVDGPNDYCPRCEAKRTSRDRLKAILIPNWEAVLAGTETPSVSSSVSSALPTTPLPALPTTPLPALPAPLPIQPALPVPPAPRPPRKPKPKQNEESALDAALSPIEEARAYLRVLVGPNRK